MIEPPRIAMVLAAGLGLRMRRHSGDTPKPLVDLHGRTLLDRTLDRLADAGVGRVVVNLHHRANMIRAHLSGRTAPQIVLSDETDHLLETGGGVTKALPLLGPHPFYVVNSDIVWRDAYANSLHALARGFDADRMDALLLLMPTIGAVGYWGMGDFNMAPDGRLTRREERCVVPFVFTGVQILHPRLFAGCTVEPFSLNRLYNKAQEAGRLFGLRHQGDWMDVGTPEGWAAAAQALGD